MQLKNLVVSQIKYLEPVVDFCCYLYFKVPDFSGCFQIPVCILVFLFEFVAHSSEDTLGVRLVIFEVVAQICEG